VSSPSLADLQSLLHEIDEALSEQPPRLRLSFAGKENRQRQLLERTREFLVALQAQWSHPPASSSEKESIAQPDNTDVEDWRSQLQNIRATLLGSLQTEIDQLQQQRQELQQEIQQLESKRAQYYSLAAQQDQQQKLISQFLERLLERLQPTLKAQMGKTLQRLETQFLSLEATPSEISPYHRTGWADSESETTTPSESEEYPLHPADRLQKLQQLQARSDRMLQDLDATLQVVFDSLLQNTRSYEQSLSQSLGQMYNLGQQGENIVAALVDALAERAQAISSPENENKDKQYAAESVVPSPIQASPPTKQQPTNQTTPSSASIETSKSEQKNQTGRQATSTPPENATQILSSDKEGADSETKNDTTSNGTGSDTESNSDTSESQWEGSTSSTEENLENDYSDIEALEASLFASESSTPTDSPSASEQTATNSPQQSRDTAEPELDDEDLTFFQDFWSQSDGESEEMTDTNNSETQQSLAASLFATEETVEEAPDFFQVASLSLESTSEIPTDSSWEEAAEFFQTASQSLETVEEFSEPETIYNEETPEDFEASASESESSNNPSINWLETITSLDELVAELEGSILPWQRGEASQRLGQENHPHIGDWQTATAQMPAWQKRERHLHGEMDTDEYIPAFPEENLLPQLENEEEESSDLSFGDTTLQRLQQDLSNLEISAISAGNEQDFEEEPTRIQAPSNTETTATKSPSRYDFRDESSEFSAASNSDNRHQKVQPKKPQNHRNQQESADEEEDDEDGTVFLNTKATPTGKPISELPTHAAGEGQTDVETEASSQREWFDDQSSNQSQNTYLANLSTNNEEDLLAALSAATPPEIKKADSESDWWNLESMETPTPSSVDEDLFADLEAAAEAETAGEPTSTSNNRNDLFSQESNDDSRSSGKKKPI
jgi:hypothetical protein